MEEAAARELLVAVNPNTSSSLPFLLLVPYGEGLLLASAGKWPRERSIFCMELPSRCWPRSPDLVDRSRVLACERRGASIDVVLDRPVRNRSQLVFTTCRGREMIFWQSPQARVRYPERSVVPASTAAGLSGLEIIVDTREKDGYDFAYQPVRLVRHRLACGDYGVVHDGRLVAAVERKSLPDLAGSLANHRLEYALAELAALPRAAVVIEEDYGQLFALEHSREARIADRLARLQVRYQSVPIIFLGTRGLAQEWIYRFLGAARQWVVDELAAGSHIDGQPGNRALRSAPAAYSASESSVRRWAYTVGLPQPEKGPIRPEVWAAWRRTHPRG
ncbi:ERCC4 domain-containing protein [Actinospica durhamensis]|uniref:ERCC4 domain-containing protein n=1 Tax=Actinospica durhamensis TaxID=1508375 RepID=A0A941IUW5_9ACTN|nr:ERCC4 domain-containing protein [Actinospica durhamensis]MBR7838153.1 ERCC4 domain-containing protein [Actinospica durhamensis]